MGTNCCSNRDDKPSTVAMPKNMEDVKKQALAAKDKSLEAINKAM